MKSIKNIKKPVVKPAFVVDATNCFDGYDLLLAFAYAKQKAGLPITDDELDAIVDDNSVTIVIREEVERQIKPKKPWYKRFGNWLIGKKN